MLVLLHVTIAISSLIYTGYIFFSPSKSKINLAYGLVAATIISGTILVVTKPAQLVSTCISGLLFLAITLPVIVTAHRRLAKEQQTDT